MPGPEGALISDQGRSGSGGEERVRHAKRARRGQPEDHPGAYALRAPHGLTARLRREYLGYDGQLLRTQQVVEYREETRSHRAWTYERSGAVGTHSLRCLRPFSGQAVHAWAKCELPPGQALREPVPPFKKLDESVVEEEYPRLAG